MDGIYDILILMNQGCLSEIPKMLKTSLAKERLKVTDVWSSIKAPPLIVKNDIVNSIICNSYKKLSSTLCLRKKCTNFETVQLKIVRMDFEDIWQKYTSE